MPRPGRTLAVAVYRPLAEQLAGVAAPLAGDRVLELSAGDDQLTRCLRTAVGATGGVDVVEEPWHFTQPDNTFALAVSLLAIDAQDVLHAVLPQLSVVARRVVVATSGGGATYDNALATAWRAVVGEEPAALPQTDPVVAPAGWRQRRLSDVARFDGIDQLFTALTGERDIEVPREHRASLRERLGGELASFTYADGTMSIPVHVTLVERG